MSDLDDKIRNIIRSIKYLDLASTTIDKPTYNYEIAQIKQVFEEERYLKPQYKEGSAINVAIDESGKPYKAMTGQEWYDRFFLELKQENTVEKFYPYYSIEKAAKKAAGL